MPSWTILKGKNCPQNKKGTTMFLSYYHLYNIILIKTVNFVYPTAIKQHIYLAENLHTI